MRAENVLQDLALANALPPGTTAAVQKIEKRYCFLKKFFITLIKG